MTKVSFEITIKEFRSMSDKEVADKATRYFKTGEGEYAHGDIFLGIRTPQIRNFAKVHQTISLTNTKKFVKSKYHEERLLGLIILVNKYKSSKDEQEKERVYQFYISHFKYINNWDLVDVTCPHIVGVHLMERDRSVLYEWIKSESLWIRRIAMISNWWFVRKGDLSDVYKMSKILINDDEDLIHKAVGWMLREAFKKDQNRTNTFLMSNYKKMPRVMLRYAIEKHTPEQRQQFLKGKI